MVIISNRDYFNKIKKQIDGLNETVSDPSNDFFEDATRSLANAISVPILQLVRDQSLARQLFGVQEMDPGAEADYPAPVFKLPDGDKSK